MTLLRKQFYAGSEYNFMPKNLLKIHLKLVNMLLLVYWYLIDRIQENKYKNVRYSVLISKFVNFNIHML